MSAIRRSMMARNADSPWLKYNQEGLIFQLDCDSKCSADQWEDLVGGIEFVGNDIELSNGVPCNNSIGYYRSSVQCPIINTSTQTIEIVAKANFQNRFFLFSDGWSSGTSIIQYIPYLSTRLDSYNYVKGKVFSSEHLTSVSIGCSTTGDPVIVNGEVVSRSTAKDKWSITQNRYYVLFGRCYNNAYIASNESSIAAIRIYNRLLSEAEIKANQAIDIERFYNR